jgi:hypothetical protein
MSEALTVDDSDTFWCCLYLVERADKVTLVYGYAVSAQEPPSQWASSSVSNCAAWRLSKVTCFLTAQTLSALCEQLQTGRLQISTKKGQIDIETEVLLRRPSVYGIPRTLISRGSPQTFSDDPAVVDSYWCVSKNALIEKTFPDVGLSPEQVREATRSLFRQLQSETSISFLTDEAGRFGNFEVVQYLSGDFRKSDGLCCLNSKSGLSLVVWIEAPLEDKGELSVNCRLFNGGGPKGRTCILNQVRGWTPGKPIRFSPQEPYGEVELSVWSYGEIVAYQRHSILRSINTNMMIAESPRRIGTKWSQHFSKELRGRAETIQLDTTLQMAVGSAQNDAWRESEDEACALVESWFPSGTKGRFFLNAQVSSLEAVEFLADLIRKPNVLRVTIVDPFLDRVGVESLLTRLGDVNEVKVLTSHVAGNGGTAIDGTIDLKAACESCRLTLPKKLEVINIESSGGGSQQFHDRYIVIESQKEGQVSVREVWMLSNSLSSLAVRYPLVVVPLSQELANQVAAYVNSLDNGQVIGRSGLQARVVWTNRPQPSPQIVATGPRLNRDYPGWKLILAMLVPDSVPDAERARIAVANGLLTEHSPQIDWHVPTKAITQVVTMVKAVLSAQAGHCDALLTAISYWAYHGGPPASAYGFDTGEVGLIRDALTQHLATQAQASRLTYEFSPLRDAVSLPECLEHVWNLLDQCRLDTRHGVTPELFFFAEALWASAPTIIVHFLDATRSFALFSWVCTEGRTNDEGAALSLLSSQFGAVQSVGVLFLRDIAEREATQAGNNHFNGIACKLVKSTLSPLTRLLSMIFISARYTRPGVIEPTPFAACASMWPTQPLSEDERRRIAALVDRATPNRAIPMISTLADECPLPADVTGFRQWCVEQMMAQFPLKPAIPQQSEIRVVSDDLTLTKAAEAAWQLYGATTSTWFRDNILNQLNLWTALEPLLRAKDYSRWSKALDSILLTMSFGIAIAKSAPDTNSQEEFQAIATPRIAEILLKLGPELWHHFGDFHGRLVNVLSFLGGGENLVNIGNINAIERIVTNEDIPNIWRLLLILHSVNLGHKYASHALSMATNPTTPASHRHSSAIDKWSQIISDSARKMAASNEELRSALVKVAERILQWRNKLLQSDVGTNSSPASNSKSE